MVLSWRSGNAARFGLRVIGLGMLVGLSRGASGADSLCGAGTTTVFSCATSGGIASLCRGVGADAGALQYRFGHVGRVALSVPASGGPSGDVFRYGDLTFSGGGGAYVRFERGGYRYTVLDATGRWGQDGRAAEVAGVAVDKGGREVSNLKCRPRTLQSSLGDDLFRSLGLEPVVSSEDYEIPEAFFPK